MSQTHRAMSHARSAHGAFGLIALIALGCAGGQTGSEVAREGNQVGPLPGRVPSRVCTTDRDCAAESDPMLAALGAPRGAPRLVGARCDVGPNCSSLACHCLISRAGAATAEVSVLDPNGCALYGRGGACLWPAGAPSCTPGPCACAAECAEAVDLLALDEARAVRATTRAARCLQTRCEVIVERGCGVGGGTALADVPDAGLGRCLDASAESER